MDKSRRTEPGMTCRQPEASTHGVDKDKTNAARPPTFKEKWENAEYRRKCIKTLWLGASFWALGFCIGQRGTSFLDLQIITHTDVETSSFFFTSFSVGYLIGCLVAGFVYDKLNKSPLLLLYLVGLAVTVVAVPWCSLYGLMIAIHFVVAFFAGGLDAVANAELIRVWGKEGETAMQFLHFSFAFGAVIAPLVTEPFLTPVSHHEDSNTSYWVSSSPHSLLSTSMPRPTSNTVGIQNTTFNSISPLPLSTNVHYAFVISGIIVFLAAIPLTVDFFQERYQKRRQDQRDEKDQVKQPLPLSVLLFVSAVLCFFYFVYCCVDDTFASFLALFVVKQLQWSKTGGAQISSIFWASFAIGRFLSIFFVRFVSIVHLMVISCVSLILSLLGFFLFAQNESDTGVWMCSVLCGMSMGPIFATGFTWMEEELVRLTGRMASAILVASSAGNIVNPVITGYLMQEFTPMYFCYLLFAESILCLLIFLFLLALARVYVRKRYVIHGHKDLEVNVASLNDTRV